jgi:hypothetical protein
MRVKDILDKIKKHKEAATGEEKFGPPSPFADGYRMAHDHIAEVVQVCVKTVDAVEVVRCRDCKKYREKFFPNGKSYGWYCSETHYGRNPNDFCSYAERREPSNEP